MFLVHHVFSSVANKYDLMNDVMSFGVHRYWKREFIRTHLNPYPGTKLLDVAGGTGDVAFEFLTYSLEQEKELSSRNDSPSSVIVCDINESMINVGQQRAAARGFGTHQIGDRLQWVVGDAMKLPFDDDQFDAYTIAFGIRNVVNIERALEEAKRVLKPGGVFACLEFSHVNNVLLKR